MLISKNNISIWFIAFLFSITSATIYSGEKQNITYPKGVCPALNSTRIDSLKKLLNESNVNWDNVKRYYFGDTYDPSLPDLIYYINKDGAVKAALVKGEKEDQELWGERYLWVLIFSDIDLNDTVVNERDKELLSSDDSIMAFRIERNVLCYEPEPGDFTISGIIKIISNFIVGTSIEVGNRREAISDSTRFIKLELHKSGNSKIFTGFSKFKLALNTKNRIVITPVKDSLDFMFTNYNFGNYESSRFGVSLGVGGTTSRFVSNADRIGLYIFGIIHLNRPTLPVKSLTWSIALGTNLTKGSFLNKIIVGMRAGLFSQVGVITGANLFLNTYELKKTGLFIGLDYKL